MFLGQTVLQVNRRTIKQVDKQDSRNGDGLIKNSGFTAGKVFA